MVRPGCSTSFKSVTARTADLQHSPNRPPPDTGHPISRSMIIGPGCLYETDFRTVTRVGTRNDHPQGGLDLGYARVSTTKQSLER
jgi:hypothetical protein